MPNDFSHHPSSYRDPSGFIFEKDAVLYRQVNKIFQEHFDHFISSGCYEHLVKKGMLLAHEEVPGNLTGKEEYYETLKPEPIPFISYPYEWSFDMLKDAALLTLQLVKEAVGYGLILKDATPYNIQWQKGKLIFIDTLSFEKYNEEEPWIAYRQFCESFLSPLLLMHYSKNPLQQLFLAYPDGIPLAVTRSLLPKRSRFSLLAYLHIHLHASIAQKRPAPEKKKIKFSKQKLLNLVSSLELLTRKLKLPAQRSAWSDYYTEATQRNDYLEQKKKIIRQWLDKIKPIRTAADLGANQGEFTRLLSGQNINTIAADLDPWCVNKLYKQVKESNEKNIQPLIIDLAIPSPAIGVNNEERSSFIGRTHVDLVLVLALVHHLAIGKNISVGLLANMFRKMSKWLVIEFVPGGDEKVKLMLANKKDIYTDYDEVHFEKAFSEYFSIDQKEPIPGSGRTLYLMTRHEG